MNELLCVHRCFGHTGEAVYFCLSGLIYAFEGSMNLIGCVAIEIVHQLACICISELCFLECKIIAYFVIFRGF